MKQKAALIQFGAIFLIFAIFASSALCQPVADRGREDLILRTIKGQEMIFARNYEEAAKIFNSLKTDYPDSPAGWFGDMAILEIRMFEREDFHLENEFLKVSAEGREKAAAALRSQRPDKIDLFLAGSLLGLDGFFNARKDRWWDAYTAGTKSRQIFKHVKAIDPSFIDADFGLGMYIYWRSVFSNDLWFLKMLPDRRAEGIAIVETVAQKGFFAKELARVNLGVMYLEEKRYAGAEKIFSDYVSRFPANVILRNLLGRVFIAEKKYDDALAQFREILRIDPSLKKPHYFIGTALVLKGDPKRFPEAESELKGFINSEKGKYWPSYAHYWLGRLFEARGENERAKKEYDIAVKLNPKIKDASTRARAMGGGV